MTVEQARLKKTMFETTPRTMIAQRQASKQPRRLLMALAILLILLVAVLVKDRQFWFGTEQATIESDLPASTTTAQNPVPAATHKAATPATSQKKQAHAAVQAAPQTENEQAPVAVTRTTLPPLDVEVVAGSKHSNVHPQTSVTHVELQNQSNIATNAADREPLPTPAAPQAQAQVSASYPLLAQHMNVQGSVIMQALISAEGLIENLRVVSGPAILTTAAQQAVREWRFKPVVQNGHAVETQARITVNFSIKVADNSATTTLADSRASDVLIISR